MLTRCDGSVRGAAHHRRRHAARWLSLRVHPGRDLDRQDERQRNGRHLREPRDLTRAVPASGPDRGGSGRLRQLDRLEAAPPPEERGDPEGRLRDSVERELSALLLELPGVEGARLRTRHPLHERGGERLTSTGPGRRGRPSPEPSSPASSSRSTSRAAPTSPSTGWAATTTRTASPSPSTGIRYCCRVTTRSSATRRSPSSTCTSPRTATPSGTTKGRCTHSSPTAARRTTTR